MFISIIGIVLSFVGLVAMFLSRDFMKKEGKDERGDKILGIAGQAAFFAFLAGNTIITIINNMGPLKNSLELNFTLTCLSALVIISFTATILVLKRRY